jgi:hypothetical protein
VVGPTPPGLIVIVTLSKRFDTEVAIMLMPPSALASPPWQVADFGPSKYEAWPGTNLLPKISAVAGGLSDAGSLMVAGTACGLYRVPT